MANGTGIVLSGTAPAMTLMSGVMLAFAENNVKIDVISTTGVGGLIGLLYLAPRGKTPQDALRELPNLFVSDWLYRLFPVNFKVFHKHSPFAKAFWEFRKALPKFYIAPDDPSEVKRFINDWMELWATALTPASAEVKHSGLMSHIPLIEDLVDFDKLRVSPVRFYLNAFSLRTLKLRFFNNQSTNTHAYNAAQAMFMLFPPVQTADDLLVSGAPRDPTGLQGIWTYERNLAQVVALDPVSRSYWRMPANAYDAFQLMLMNPIAALQELMFSLYTKTRDAGGDLPPLYRIPLSIDESYYPTMLEWTHANAVKLQKIGHDAAVDLAKLLAADQVDRAALEAFSFAKFIDGQPRPAQFRKMFMPTFTSENFPKVLEFLRERYGQTQYAPSRGREASS